MIILWISFGIATLAFGLTVFAHEWRRRREKHEFEELAELMRNDPTRNLRPHGNVNRIKK